MTVGISQADPLVYVIGSDNFYADITVWNQACAFHASPVNPNADYMFVLARNTDFGKDNVYSPDGKTTVPRIHVNKVTPDAKTATISN